jgi:hypothetical protein
MRRKTDPAVKAQRKAKKAQIKANLQWDAEHKDRMCSVYGCNALAWSSDVTDHKQYCDNHLPEFVRENAMAKQKAWLDGLRIASFLSEATRVDGYSLLNELGLYVNELSRMSSKFTTKQARYK